MNRGSRFTLTGDQSQSFLWCILEHGSSSDTRFVAFALFER